MNAAVVLSLHGSLEGIMRKAGGNAGQVSELLMLRKYAERFGRVYVFSHDSKKFESLLPENCVQVRLWNRFVYLLAGWLVLLLWCRFRKIGLVRLVGSASLPVAFLSGRLGGAKVVLKYYYLWHNAMTNPLKADVPLKAKLMKRVERFLLRFVDCVIACNDDVRRFVNDRGKILPVNEGIAAAAFDPGKVKADAATARLGGVRFVFAGRLNAFKDPVTLMKAYKLAKARSPSIRLVICGDGELLEECRRLADDGVVFRGFVGNVASVMKAADAFVISSAYDASPRSLMEAMCMGLPCIATKAGGMPEYLNGCGVLVPARSPERLADAMAKLAKDAALRKRLGKKARERVLKLYDLEKNLDAELGIVMRMLPKNGKKS